MFQRLTILVLCAMLTLVSSGCASPTKPLQPIVRDNQRVEDLDVKGVLTYASGDTRRVIVTGYDSEFLYTESGQLAWDDLESVEVVDARKQAERADDARTFGALLGRTISGVLGPALNCWNC